MSANVFSYFMSYSTRRSYGTIIGIFTGSTNFEDRMKNFGASLEIVKLKLLRTCSSRLQYLVALPLTSSPHLFFFDDSCVVCWCHSRMRSFCCCCVYILGWVPPLHIVAAFCLAAKYCICMVADSQRKKQKQNSRVKWTRHALAGIHCERALVCAAHTHTACTFPCSIEFSLNSIAPLADIRKKT